MNDEQNDQLERAKRYLASAIPSMAKDNKRVPPLVEIGMTDYAHATLFVFFAKQLARLEADGIRDAALIDAMRNLVEQWNDSADYLYPEGDSSLPPPLAPEPPPEWDPVKQKYAVVIIHDDGREYCDRYHSMMSEAQITADQGNAISNATYEVRDGEEVFKRVVGNPANEGDGMQPWFGWLRPKTEP